MLASHSRGIPAALHRLSYDRAALLHRAQPSRLSDDRRELLRSMSRYIHGTVSSRLYVCRGELYLHITARRSSPEVYNRSLQRAAAGPPRFSKPFSIFEIALSESPAFFASSLNVSRARNLGLSMRRPIAFSSGASATTLSSSIGLPGVPAQGPTRVRADGLASADAC